MNKDPKRLRRDEAKLDMLDGIDEEIVERNTEKRISLMTLRKRKKRKRIAIPVLAGAASFLLLFSAIVLLFPKGGEKQVPIYQGMTVSAEYTGGASAEANPNNARGAIYLSREANAGEAISILRAGSFTLSNDVDSGAQSGLPEGGEGDSDPLTDLESESDSETETETGTETESPIQDVGAASELYYAKPNQVIYITVHFSNPDNFEIMSFTLNGKKFSSYMFEEGSDMENLVLKQQVGSELGIEEFTIDAIKYVDGTEIKDVRMDGERTVRVGVYEKEIPTWSATDPVSSFYSVSASFEMEDEITLFALSGANVRAVLYQGAERIAEKDISLTDIIEGTTVIFDGLSLDTEYRMVLQIALPDQGGIILWERNVRTKDALAIENLTAGQENISFEAVWREDYPTKEILSIKIYDGETPVKELLTDARAAEGLLSGHIYRLEIVYRDGEGEKKIDETFTTKGKTAPTVAIEGDSDQTSVDFEVTVTDPDGLCSITKIELLHGEDEPLVAENVDARSFGGLWSNNDYTVRVTYTYDLNNGEGVQTKTSEELIKTEAKAIPAVIIEGDSDQTSIDFELTVTDPDSLYTLTKIELLHGRASPVVAENVGVRGFENLLSNNLYTVRITYTYDLNDGEGLRTRAVTQSIRTAAKVTPVYTITRGDTTEESVSFTLTETDVDNIGAVKKIELLRDGTVVAMAADTSTRSFNGLDAQKLYVVKLTYEYDLNDGAGVQSREILMPISTKMVKVTDISISGNSVVKPGDTVTLVLAVNDSNATVTHAVINGVRCELQKMGNKNYRVQYTSTSEGGKEILRCTELTYTSGEWTLSESVEYLSSASLLIQGEISIESLTLSRNGEYFAGDDRTATIVIAGADGYSEIEALKVYTGEYDEVGQELSLTRVNGNTYTFTLPAGQIYNDTLMSEFFFVSGVVCDLDGGKSDVFFEQKVEISYVVMGSSYQTVIDISTAEQLQNMQSGKAYRLVADVDLEDFRWVPYDFSGVLYGNGYKIKNLYLYQYYGGSETVGAVRGMFGDFYGYMKDVVLENASVTIEKNGALGYHEPGDMPIGLLAGDASGLIKGCTVEGTLSVLVDRFGYEPTVGGLTGRAFYGLILDGCSIEVTMAFNRGFDPMYIGLVVGRGESTYSRCDSSNCQFLVNGQPYSPYQ